MTALTDEAPRPKPEVTIYTDGGCVPNPGAGAWACVLLYTKPDGVEVAKELSGFAGMTTNSEMELTAAIRGLEALKGPCDVTIISDSRYVVDGINTWMWGWAAAGWRRKKGAVENLAQWMRIHKLVETHTVKAEWVKGHSGDKWNTRCDKIVREVYKAHGVSVPAMFK